MSIFKLHKFTLLRNPAKLRHLLTCITRTKLTHILVKVVSRSHRSQTEPKRSDGFTPFNFKITILKKKCKRLPV